MPKIIGNTKGITLNQYGQLQVDNSRNILVEKVG